VDENGTLTAEDLLPWLKKVDKLIVLAAAFNDRMGEATLKAQLENIGDMYKIVTGEVAPHLVKGESVGARGRVGGGSGEG
jgi:hypothetical protein